MTIISSTILELSTIFSLFLSNDVLSIYKYLWIRIYFLYYSFDFFSFKKLISVSQFWIKDIKLFEFWIYIYIESLLPYLETSDPSLYKIIFFCMSEVQISLINKLISRSASIRIPDSSDYYIHVFLFFDSVW